MAADPDYGPHDGLPRPWTVRLNDDWTFEITGLTGPVRFAAAAATPAGWWLESVYVDGVNAADQPVTFGAPDRSRSQVEIVFSSPAAEIAGRVLDERDEPIRRYEVVVFPVDRARWDAGSRYIRTARPAAEARFSVPSLPPGDYWIAAVESLSDIAVRDPEVLSRLIGAARRVTLSDGQRLTTELSVSR